MATLRELKWHILVSAILTPLFAWFVFMAFDNTPPYEYDGFESFVTPSPANEGDQITVWWRITRVNRYCPGVGHRRLFDPKTGAILASYDPVPVGFPGSVKEGWLPRTFLLPRNLLAGPIMGYRQIGCYKCNLYQLMFDKPICVTTPDLLFKYR